MKLGPLDLQTDLILAPMMDVMTPTFRKLIRDCGGVGLVVTPMVFVQQFALAPKTIIPHLETIEKERPVAVQIVASGKNEENIQKAIELLNCYNFDILDINAGCPAFHTMKSGGGGSLIKNLSDGRLHKVIESCTKYSTKPISVKTRLGYDTDTQIFEIMKMIEKLGVTYVTIHGRCVKQNYSGSVNLERINEIQQISNIPIVGNGDVIDFTSYQKMKSITHCTAVMIGRAAMSNPSIFQKIWETNQTNNEKIKIKEFQYQNTLSEIFGYLTQIENNINLLSSYWNNDRFKLAELRRTTIWLIKGIPGYKRAREILSKIYNLQELRKFIFGGQLESCLTNLDEELQTLKENA